jgi:hypothetical protein
MAETMDKTEEDTLKNEACNKGILDSSVGFMRLLP